MFKTVEESFSIECCGVLILKFNKFTFSNFSPLVLSLSFSLEFYEIHCSVLSERIKNIIIDNFMDLSCLKLSETQILKLRGHLNIILLY